MPRILLAGMNKFPNQFTRYLSAKGCEVVHVSGDPGGHIPTDCEAVIITKCQISHEKFYKTKELYKDLDKPVFITDYGITPIKERLEAFLSKFPKVTKAEPETVMATAFKKEMPTYMKSNDKADKIIENDYKNSVPIRETLTKLKEMRQPDGNPYSVNYISTLRSRLSLKVNEKPKAEKKVATPAPSRERRVEQPKPDKAVKQDKGVLIYNILSSAISTNEKANLIWQLLTGSFIEPQVVVTKSKDGLKFSTVHPISMERKDFLTLSQQQATAVLQHLAQVEDFATDPNA